MISRTNRFIGRAAIARTYKNSVAVRVNALNLRLAPAKPGKFRLAVVVSKKVSKSAVVRNRIRRRLYEQFRLIAKEKSGLTGDMILTVFDERVANMSASELRSQCVELLEKAEKRSANITAG